MGRVYRRGRTWTYVLDVGKTPDGRRQQKTKGGFPSKREAERAMREVMASIDAQRYVERNSMTVAEFVRDEWLPAVAPPNLRESTWASYRRELEGHLIPHLGGLPLQDLNAAHLNKLYVQLLNNGRQRGEGGLSARTVRYLHTVVRKALADAERWGLVARNPAALADPPRQRTGGAGTHIRTWTPEELRRFLDHVSGDRLYAAWLLMASTGMRRGEVLGVRWTDVDLDAARVTVRQTLVLVSGEPRYSEPKTPRSRRSIDLDTRTVQVLRDWQKTQREERDAWGEAWQDLGLVFTREDGSWVHPDSWSGAFDRYVRQAGLPRIRLHDLRHSHASHMLAAGVNPKIVSERLGHHSVAFTLDTYAHLIPGMQAEAAEQISDLIFGQDGPDEGGSRPPEQEPEQGPEQDPEQEL